MRQTTLPRRAAACLPLWAVLCAGCASIQSRTEQILVQFSESARDLRSAMSELRQALPMEETLKTQHADAKALLQREEREVESIAAMVEDGDIHGGGYALLAGPGTAARYDNLAIKGYPAN